MPNFWGGGGCLIIRVIYHTVNPINKDKGHTGVNIVLLVTLWMFTAKPLMVYMWSPFNNVRFGCVQSIFFNYAIGLFLFSLVLYGKGCSRWALQIRNLVGGTFGLEIWNLWKMPTGTLYWACGAVWIFVYLKCQDHFLIFGPEMIGGRGFSLSHVIWWQTRAALG